MEAQILTRSDIMPIYSNLRKKKKVDISRCTIFRHNKHSNFYGTVNIRRLILGKFLNFKNYGKSPDHVESGKRITLTCLCISFVPVRLLSVRVA
jgi:hypothetical protein